MPEISVYSFGSFRLDLRSASLRRDGQALPLRPKSFDVLLYLMRQAGRVVTKDELMDGVWANIAVTENSLVQCIKDIRQALGDDAQQIVQTVAKRGYLFAATVTAHGEGEPTPVASPTIASPDVRESPRRTYAGAILLCIMLGGGVWFWATRPSPVPAARPVTAEAATPSRLSIAVLPFTAGPDAAIDDYFSAGIAEDISTALGRFPELAVVTPTLARNAADIKARYLVNGTIRRVNDRVRLSVRLNETASGVLLWSESYDAPNSSILAIQDDVALHVAGALAVKLTNIEQRRAAEKHAANMEAYDLVLRGRDLMTRLNRTSHSEARKMFERAIALDAGSAAAYVGLGRVDLSAVALGWTANPEEALERAQTLARRAIAIDEFSPSAHALLGRAFARSGDYERAVDVLRRAVALNPSNPEGLAALGEAQLWNGDSAGTIASLETAIAMDPRRSAEDLFNLGTAYFVESRNADALRTFERATTRNEGNPFIFAMLAALYAEAGRANEAQAAAAEVRKLNPLFNAENFGTLFRQAAHRDKVAQAVKKAGL